MITKLKYYISNSKDPYKNLAIEKHLFDIVENDCAILYLWQNENTVVIGKNQNSWAECRCKELSDEGGKIARRLSGGGAVFHDIGNLNFTFLSSTDNMDIKRNLGIISSACKMAGIETEFSGRNDLLADSRKFSGNAFYNSKGKSYHHGTILVSVNKDKLTRYLTPPKAKLDAKGIKSVKSRVVNLSELSDTLTVDKMKEYILSSFINHYNIKAEEIHNIDIHVIKSLEDEYSSWDYIYGKVLPFTISAGGNISIGNVELLLEIKNGAIINTQCFTDSMDIEVSENICHALNNCKFKSDELLKSLRALPYGKEIYDLLIEKAM